MNGRDLYVDLEVLICIDFLSSNVGFLDYRGKYSCWVTNKK